MSLFERFILLYPKAPETPRSDHALEQLSNLMLTQADLTLADKKRTAAYREAPTLRPTYDAFLTLCQNTLGKQAQTPLLPLIIDYLGEVDASLEQARFHTKLIRELFTFNLHTQNNTLSIASLGRTYVDNPKAFAAFLHYLIQQNLTPETILQTHLMQDYLRYHLRGLNTPNNPVALLYSLLNQHSETQALAQHAKKTCCPEPELASYALDGTTCTQEETLNNPPHTRPITKITPTDYNLKALHRVFGVPFLVGALRWCFDNGHDSTHTPILQTLFNGTHVTHADFVLLLQHLRDHDHLKQTLASLLHDATIDELMNARIRGITSLLNYSTHLAHRINGKELHAYIRDLKQTSLSHLDLIADLSIILKEFKNRNKSHALIAFQHLLEAILEHPEVLDDEKLLRLLRKFHATKARLSEYSLWLEQTFDRMLATHTNTSWEAFDYIPVEDIWREVHLKLRTIQTIENISDTLPSDKYKLQCRLLNVFLAQRDKVFMLDDFIQKLGIEPNIHDQDITPYERLLIEILVSVDNNALRADIMSRLNTALPETRVWQDARLDDSSLHMHAARHGNLGFIMWLELHNIKHPESYEALTTTAADLKHWSLVQYLHQTHALNRLVVGKLLHAAVSQNASHAIPLLWQDKPCVPRREVVEQSFGLAVKEGHANCIRALLLCPTPPCDTTITKGYKKALHTHQTAIIRLILEAAETRELPCLHKAIHHEARHKKREQFGSPKLPKVSHIQSYDSFISATHSPTRRAALQQHGFFQQDPEASRLNTSLVLPPLLLRQTSV